MLFHEEQFETISCEIIALKHFDYYGTKRNNRPLTCTLITFIRRIEVGRFMLFRNPLVEQ